MAEEPEANWEENNGPGTRFHAPLPNSIPKLKPLGLAKNCARCGKKFNFIRLKYHCRNCGNVICSRCSDHRVELLKFGIFNPARVCDLCHHFLGICAMEQAGLSSLPVKKLREFIAAFDLPSSNAIEKDDLVRIIIASRPMPDRNEIYFREHVPIAEPAISNENTSGGEVPAENNAPNSTNYTSNNGHARRPAERSQTPSQNGNRSNYRRDPNNNGRNHADSLRQQDSQQTSQRSQNEHRSHSQSRHQPQSQQQSMSNFFNPQIFENIFEQLLQFTNSQSSPTHDQNSASSNQNDMRTQLPPPNPRSNHFPSTSQFHPFVPDIHPHNYSFSGNHPSSSSNPPPSNNASRNRPTSNTSTRDRATPNYSYYTSSHSSSHYSTPPPNFQAQPPPPPQTRTTSANKGQNEAISIETIIKNKTDITTLSIKTIKKILTDNCVDYSGIFEKNELVLKVERLVVNSKKEMATDVDALGDDALCKICCDAVQNCVILDCGHMSTCMDCGKKLQEARNECPICRESIIKLIRVYRA